MEVIMKKLSLPFVFLSLLILVLFGLPTGQVEAAPRHGLVYPHSLLDFRKGSRQYDGDCHTGQRGSGKRVA